MTSPGWTDTGQQFGASLLIQGQALDVPGDPGMWAPAPPGMQSPINLFRRAVPQISAAGGFLAANTAEGTATGTAVTPVNSAAGGTPFTAVNIGSGATFAFDTTQAMHGTSSYKVATVAAANSYVTWTAPGAGAMPPTSWFRMYLYVTANPAAAFRLFTFLQDTGRCAYLQLGTSGQLQFIDHNVTTMCQTSAVPLSAWFRVEGYLTGDPAAGQAELQLFTLADGLLPAETDTSAGGQNTTGTANGFAAGPFTAANVGPYWIDDLGVSTSGYMGPTQPLANPPTVTTTITMPVPVVEQDQTVTPATVTVTAAFPQATTGVWATATPATVTAAVTARNGWIDVGRVGVYLSGSLGAAGGGMTFTDATAMWQSWSAPAPQVTRYYLAASNFTYQASMQQMVAAGTKICLTLRPAYSPVSATDLANMTTLLQTLQAAGAIVDVALWHEPYYQGLTSAQYIAMIQYYGPTVRQYYPLVFVPNVASLATHGEAAYYPGDAWVDKVAADIYDSQYKTGQNLTAAAAIADGATPRNRSVCGSSTGPPTRTTVSPRPTSPRFSATCSRLWLRGSPRPR